MYPSADEGLRSVKVSAALLASMDPHSGAAIQEAMLEASARSHPQAHEIRLSPSFFLLFAAFGALCSPRGCSLPIGVCVTCLPAGSREYLLPLARKGAVAGRQSHFIQRSIGPAPMNPKCDSQKWFLRCALASLKRLTIDLVPVRY